MIRTLVCASSDLARAGLAAVVRGDARLILAGETTPHDLERQIAALDPDVVVEQADGSARMLQATVALVDDPRGAWANEAHVREEIGPHALLARDATPQEITAAVIAVAAGLVAIAPSTLDNAGAPSTRVNGAAQVPGRLESERLTAREIEVLAELARGVANKAIATRLGISDHTVKFHIASIFSKLGVSSRTEAVTHGVRLGLVML